MVDNSIPSVNTPSVNVQFENIDPAMREYSQFFLWRWQPEKESDHLTKVPKWLSLNPKTGRHETYSVPSNHRAAWHSFEECRGIIEAYARRLLSPSLGLAFRFAPLNPFAFIDLDHCRDPLTGTIEPWAIAYILRFNSYTEASASGTGIKIFIRGEKPGTRCRDKKQPHTPELYDKTQFSTVTGNRIDLPGLSKTIQERQSVLAEVYNELFPPELERERIVREYGDRPAAIGRELPDEWVIRKLESKPYWIGPNKSEQDQVLANQVAYYVGTDAARIERIMFEAPARRGKWKRRDYIQGTIEKAIERSLQRGFYSDYLAKREEEDAALNDTESAQAFVDQTFADSAARRETLRATREANRVQSPETKDAAVNSVLFFASMSTSPDPAFLAEVEARSSATKLSCHVAHQPDGKCDEHKHPGYRCKNANCVGVEDKRNAGAGAVLFTICCQWDCPLCGLLNKDQKVAYYRELLTNVSASEFSGNGAPEGCLWVADLNHLPRFDPGKRDIEWKRLYAQMSRAASRRDGRLNYVAVLYGCNLKSVSTDRFDGAEPMSREDAIEFITWVINGIPSEDIKDPIRASRKWTQPRLRKNKSHYRRLTAFGDFTWASVLAALEVKLATDLKTTNTLGGVYRGLAGLITFQFPTPLDSEMDLLPSERHLKFFGRVHSELLGLPDDIETAPMPSQDSDQDPSTYGFELDLPLAFKT